MAVSVASNIASLRAQRQVSKASDSLAKTFQRLSSGLRINGAADDAAGLSLADSLRANAKIASIAVRNANDGISITSLTDAGLDEIINNLQRMAELATQSSNGVYTNTQRSALSSEFIALGSEVERIAATTTFNGIALLSNSPGVTLQVGLDGTTSSQISISGVLGTLNSMGLGSAGGALTFSIIASTSAASQAAAAAALSAVNAAIVSVGVQRGIVGAAESRLNSAVSYLQVVRENFIAAESRIRDADVAQEVAEMVRLQVLQQASTAVLAQANLQPQIALTLLRV